MQWNVVPDVLPVSARFVRIWTTGLTTEYDTKILYWDRLENFFVHDVKTTYLAMIIYSGYYF